MKSVFDQIYMVPKIGTGTREDPYRPKYFDKSKYSASDFGSENWMLVRSYLPIYERHCIADEIDVHSMKVIPTVAHKIARFIQAYTGVYASRYGVTPGILGSWSKEFGSLPTDVRAMLVATVMDGGLTTAWLKKLTTIRSFTSVGDTLAICAAAFQSSACQLSPAWMTLPATDTFTRADENPITGSWTANVNNFKIVTNLAHGASFGGNLVRWNADTFPNDQYSQLVMGSSPSDGGPAVRVSTSGADTCYYFDAKGGNSGVLQKRVAGSSTNLESSITSPVSTDTIKITANGTALALFINGTQTDAGTTDSAITAGSGGMYDFDATAGYKNFEAGSLGSPTFVPGIGTVILTGASPSLSILGPPPGINDGDFSSFIKFRLLPSMRDRQ